MFDFTPDNKHTIRFDLYGNHIQSDTFNTILHDDLRLLLALGDDADAVVKRIESFYSDYMKEALDEYSRPFYLRMLYIDLAYYLAFHGYTHEAAFSRALEYIDDGSTLFPWTDAIEYEKQGVDGWENVLAENFGDKAPEMAALMTGDESLRYAKIEGTKTPTLLTSVLCLSQSGEKKLEARKKELLRIREAITQRTRPLKKPTFSSVVSGGNRYFTRFEEGEIVAYRIGSGQFQGKYALLHVDYIRQTNLIRCDFERMVRHEEEFAVINKLYDEPPETLPPPFYRALDEKDGHAITLLECRIGKKECANFNPVKIGKADPPRFERYYEDEVFFGLPRYITCNIGFYTLSNLDELLNSLFAR